MNTLNDKVFIPARAGVKIIHDNSAQQFIPERSFDYNAILGLDKPKNRVKALTAPTSPKNCRIGKTFYSYSKAFEKSIADEEVNLVAGLLSKGSLSAEEVLLLTGCDIHIQDSVKP